MRAIARERGGECLSAEYLKPGIKLRWRCAHGHEWEAAPRNVIYGNKTWCPHCAGNARYTLADMQALAQKHGGQCLGPEYKNNETPLTWQCVEGHRWQAAPYTILDGIWCPRCDGRLIRSLEGLHQLAAERGGQCLSLSYPGGHQLAFWECKHGHRWWNTPRKINAGQWCPHCARLSPLTLLDMRKVAKERGGYCLSTAYVNVDTKLQWECDRGHTWWSRPDNIIYGQTWCPECAYEAMRGKKRRRRKL